MLVIAARVMRAAGILSALTLCASSTWATDTSAPDKSSEPRVVRLGGGPKPARLADGHPNWTGFWSPFGPWEGGVLDENFGPGAKIPPPTAPQDAQGNGVPIPPHTPLKDPYREPYEQRLQASLAGKVISDPTAKCLPPGMPSMMDMVYGMEVLQTPGQITLTSEWAAESRRIWLDGRKHPNPDETLSTYAGHSIGHWEHDTLVVDTVGIRDDVALDGSGLPHSAALHIIERLSSPKPGFLVDEITINDPAVYAAPWSYKTNYRFRPDLNLMEYVCEENNRNVGPNGEPKFQ